MEASHTSRRQHAPGAIARNDETDTIAHASAWGASSALRWRPDAGRQIIVLTRWSTAASGDEDQTTQADLTNGEQPEAAKQASSLLPPLEMLRVIANRWARVVNSGDSARPALLAFRSAGALAPAEVARWCPGATVRLYTLGGPVPPLPDTTLAEPPLDRYSVVRAPNMSFWPQLRALIEEQEREAPGLELWEDQGRDLALLEQELAWWLASPQGLVLNLYDGDDLVGHLSLARQRDETEGCDGWGIIALHIARRARGQRLGMLLQRVAATLIHTRRLARRTRLIETGAMPAVTLAAAAQDEAPQRDVAQIASDQGGEAQNANAQHDADQANVAPAEQTSAPDAPDWPYLFGFVAAQNLPALRGAYGAGRRIIGTYVDVPVEALQAVTHLA